MASRGILEFYEGWFADHKGRTLVELQGWSDDALEDAHDYIQWLFPLAERSGANSRAPVLDDSQITAFQRSPELRRQLLKSFDRMLAFYGLQRRGCRVEQSEAWNERSKIWLKPGSHNFHRITRILKSMSMLGEKPYAEGLLAKLRQLYEAEHAETIGSETFRFWCDAVNQRIR